MIEAFLISKILLPWKKDGIKRIANFGDRVNQFYLTNYEFGKENVKTNLFFIPNDKNEKEKWQI